MSDGMPVIERANRECLVEQRAIPGSSLFHICREHPRDSDAPCVAGSCVALCGYVLTLRRSRVGESASADTCVVCDNIFGRQRP